MAGLPLSPHGPFLSSEVQILLLPALLEMLKPRNRWSLSGAMCKTLLLFPEAEVHGARLASAGPIPPVPVNLSCFVYIGTKTQLSDTPRPLPKFIKVVSHSLEQSPGKECES